MILWVTAINKHERVCERGNLSERFVATHLNEFPLINLGSGTAAADDAGLTQDALLPVSAPSGAVSRSLSHLSLRSYLNFNFLHYLAIFLQVCNKMLKQKMEHMVHMRLMAEFSLSLSLSLSLLLPSSASCTGVFPLID